MQLIFLGSESGLAHHLFFPKPPTLTSNVPKRGKSTPTSFGPTIHQYRSTVESDREFRLRGPSVDLITSKLRAMYESQTESCFYFSKGGGSVYKVIISDFTEDPRGRVVNYTMVLKVVSIVFPFS